MRTTLIHVLLVGSGGFIGAVLRYGLAGLVQNRASLATFPHGTLAVNLIGCFLIGSLAGLVDTRQLFSPEFRIFALIGLLGGFTTFSTFGYEAFVMLRAGEYVRSASYVVLHVVLGLALVWSGYLLAVSRWNQS